jgi:flagellar basal-body rod protein FlgF
MSWHAICNCVGMVNGIYSARNGMMLLQNMVDNTTNNLSNANTTAFKKSLMVSEAEVKNRRNDEAKLHHDENHWMATNKINWEQGSLIGTGNSMDLAIEGDGFFMVETPAGVRYTRSGSFTRNGNGEVVSLQGDKVLDQGGSPIVTEGSRIQISNNGNVNVDGKKVGQIALMQIADKSKLVPEGRNHYMLPEDSGQSPEVAERANIRQGYLEASNVNVVESMVELIRFQRNYELDQKAVTSEDETLGKAVNEIGRI